jgi:hypothetical protein
MPEVVRGNTIEVGEAVVHVGSKIEACDQLKQALMGDLRPRQTKVARQKLRYSCRRGNSATGTRPVARARHRSKLRVFAGRSGPQAVVLLRKPRMQVVRVSLFES